MPGPYVFAGREGGGGFTGLYSVDTSDGTQTNLDSANSIGFSSLFAASADQATMVVRGSRVDSVNLSTLAVTNLTGIPVATSASKDIALSPNGSITYASSPVDRLLRAYATATGSVLVTSVQTIYSVGGQTYGSVLDQSGTYLYVGSQIGGTTFITKLDTATLTRTWQVSDSNTPFLLGATASVLYCLTATGFEKRSTTDGSVASTYTLPGGAGVTRAALSADATTAYLWGGAGVLTLYSVNVAALTLNWSVAVNDASGGGGNYQTHFTAEGGVSVLADNSKVYLFGGVHPIGASGGSITSLYAVVDTGTQAVSWVYGPQSIPVGAGNIDWVSGSPFGLAIPPTAPPSAPGNPSTPNGAGVTFGVCEGAQVTLQWDSVATATSYNVYRSGVFLGSVMVPTYVDTDVRIGGSYAYAITAVNVAGESPFSPSLRVVPCSGADCCDWGRTEAPSAGAWSKTENCTAAVTTRAGVPSAGVWTRTEESCT